MAVQLIVAIQRYLGLSTDTKPATPPIGSLFLELDSRLRYIFDGTVWKQQP